MDHEKVNDCFLAGILKACSSIRVVDSWKKGRSFVFKAENAGVMGFSD